MKVRKRFGQHFLHDKNIIRNIVHAINPRPGDHIVEIGPGHGAITALIHASGCTFDVIEIDQDFISSLELKYPGVNVIASDALKFDFAAYYRGKRIRVIGNLPYNISTPLLFKLFKQPDIIIDMHFMLQLEVVNRMIATASTPDYGRLSIMSQVYCATEKLFSVPPRAFMPVPKVMSAMARLKPHLQARGNFDTARLEQLLIEAFSQRRKQIHNALKRFVTAEDLVSLNLSPSLRPENLTLEDYIKITQHN